MADDGRNEEARVALSLEQEGVTILEGKTTLARNKARRVAGIRAALALRKFERTPRELQIALEEFSKEEELDGLQTEFINPENATTDANGLYECGRRQVCAGEFDAGIAKLRQACKLDSKNRRIESALFDALLLFAKSIVDLDPKRARRILEEATQLSPFNLTLENAALYLSNRIRERALKDCTIRVQILRDNGKLHEALKLVDDLSNEFHFHENPVLEQIRTGICDDIGNVVTPASVGTAPPNGNDQEAESVRVEPVRYPAMLASLRRHMQSLVIAIGKWGIRERSGTTLQIISVEAQALKARAHDWGYRSRSALTGLRWAYKTGTGVVCLLLIVATVVVGTSLRRQPVLTSIGTGTILFPVTLLREPSASSRVLINLKAGQAVEILTELPAVSLEAWTLIRPAGDKKNFGYVHLLNLDRIKTDNRMFDLWHAMTFLNRTSRPEDLRDRLATVDHSLQTDPLPLSPDADLIYFNMAKAFALLALESPGDLDSARAALGNAESYLTRVAGDLQVSDEADELKASIHKSQIAFGIIAIEPASIPPPTRSRDEEFRIMRLANSAFAESTYEKAAEYGVQVLKLNKGNLEAMKLLEAAREAQKSLEADIIERTSKQVSSNGK